MRASSFARPFIWRGVEFVSPSVAWALPGGSGPAAGKAFDHGTTTADKVQQREEFRLDSCRLVR